MKGAQFTGWANLQEARLGDPRSRAVRSRKREALGSVKSESRLTVIQTISVALGK